ncbi:MAG: hypothetical protein LBO04_06670 [Spirochaetaceae bacterium]|jgi:hypothetical protein|nr:hypothetical protein [Spirochaetaceae bacterium]
MKKTAYLILFALAGFVSAASQSRPAWVDNPAAVYPDRQYVSAVGAGPDRKAAESAALASLAAFFRQSVSTRSSIRDRETQVNGDYYSRSDISLSIETSAALDSLIGAETRETWNDTPNRLWYAVALMDKGKCAALYSAELDRTAREVEALTAMPDGPTFEAVARCGKARKLAADAAGYALVLSMLDGPDRRKEVSELAASAAAAQDKAKTIPVEVRVKGDSGGRIKAAFASALTAWGFKTGGRASRYVLDVTFTRTAAPRNAFFNTRYTVDAALIDTSDQAELFTFNIADRESHTAGQEDADYRALIGATRKIAEAFPPVLTEYLDSTY